jgi:anti-sigma factor RsiW
MIDSRDEDLIHACVDGELSPEDSDRFAQLLQDAEARHQLEQLRALSEMLDAEPDDIDPPPCLVDDVMHRLAPVTQSERFDQKPASAVQRLLALWRHQPSTTRHTWTNARVNEQTRNAARRAGRR